MKRETTNKAVSHSSRENNNRKKNIKVDVKRLAIVIVLGIFAIYFIYMVIWQQIDLSRKNKQIAELEQKIESATAETERLQAELDNLSDPEYLEQVARERLGLIRPNERVFMDANKSE